MLKDRCDGSCSPSLASSGGHIETLSNLEVAICAGCGGKIHDRFYLLAVDRRWHAACLKCCECKLPLDTELTCFARDGNIYCKEDYYRMFAVSRCGRCHAGISANELVMRARDLVYHMHCFTCASCHVPLSTGDHFGMREGLVYCRPHYELLDYCDPMDLMYRGPGDRDSPGYYTNSTTPTPGQKGRPRKRKLCRANSPATADMPVAMRMTAAQSLEVLHPTELSSSMESLSYDSSVTSPGSGSGHNNQRSKRMRTSFKHHQLRTMKSYFAINQNPDAKDLKQLAQKTGLSKRVLQVWFQNARAKWRRNIMRHEGPAGTPSGTPVPGQTAPPSPNSHVSSLLQQDSSNGSLSSAQLHSRSPDLHSHHSIHGQLTFNDIY